MSRRIILSAILGSAFSTLTCGAAWAQPEPAEADSDAQDPQTESPPADPEREDISDVEPESEAATESQTGVPEDEKPKDGSAVDAAVLRAETPSEDAAHEPARQIQPVAISVAPAVEEAPTVPPIRLALGAEFIYLNVQGKGGFRNRSADPIGPETPGSSVYLDRATLDVEADVTPWLSARVRFRATGSEGFVDRAHLDAQAIAEELRFQLGYNCPYIRVDRRTESYGLLQSAYFDSRQLHFQADYTPSWGPFSLRLAPSVQTQRPQGPQNAANDDGLPILGFDHARVDESNPAEYGGLGGVGLHGAFIGGYFYRGQLLDNDDPLYLERLFTNYDLAGDTNDRTNEWGGLRAGFSGYNVWLHADWIPYSKQGLLQRSAIEATASYTFSWKAWGKPMELEPLIRFSQLEVETFAPDYQVPETWDRTQWAAALMYRPVPEFWVHVEYLRHEEDPGVSREGKTSVKNDEVLVLLEFEVSNEGN